MDATSYEAPRSLSAEEQALLERQKEDITVFKRNKLELEACKNWDRFYKRNGTNFFKDRHWSKDEFQEIFKDVDLTQNLVFLEAGCGVGNMLFPLTEYFPNWRFYGFDFSRRAIEELHKRSEESGLEVTSGVLDLTSDSERLDFPSADLATFIFVLSAIHPDKHDQAIRNLRNYIKPGGLVFFRDYGVLDYAMIRFGRGTKLADRFYVRQDGTRAFYFYADELKALFERNGFTSELCEYLHKKTTNHEKQLNVNRVFVQGRFRRI